MTSDIKVIKKKEPIVERLNIPTTLSQFQRYKKLAHELNSRELTKLHDLTRERIEILLNEVEGELAKSS